MAHPECTIDTAKFPMTLTVPRASQLVPVTAADVEQLQSLRMEIELLLSVQQELTAAGASPNSSLTTESLADDRRDLACSIQDAVHPLVLELANRIDREFPHLCEEGFPAVIREEAGQIVQAAIHAGVAVVEGASPQMSENAPQVDPIAGEDLSATLDELLELTSATVDTMAEVVSGQYDMTTNEMNQEVTSIDTPAEPTAEIPREEPRLAIANAVAPEAASVAEPELNPKSAGSPVAEGDWPPMAPERAVAALDEIEKGIRKLSGILSTEVHQQWGETKQLFQDIQTASQSIRDARQLAETQVAEIARFKEEARIGRDECEVARREARLFRDDARKSKERAENSAAIAELAANQAQREAENSRTQSTEVSPSVPD